MQAWAGIDADAAIGIEAGGRDILAVVVALPPDDQPGKSELRRADLHLCTVEYDLRRRRRGIVRTRGVSRPAIWIDPRLTHPLRGLRDEVALITAAIPPQLQRLPADTAQLHVDRLMNLTARLPPHGHGVHIGVVVP